MPLRRDRRGAVAGEGRQVAGGAQAQRAVGHAQRECVGIVAGLSVGEGDRVRLAGGKEQGRVLVDGDGRRAAHAGGLRRRISRQRGNQQVGHRGAQAGHQVVAGRGRIGPVAAGGHVVEVGAGEAVKRRQGLGKAVEGRLPIDARGPGWRWRSVRPTWGWRGWCRPPASSRRRSYRARRRPCWGRRPSRRRGPCGWSSWFR